MPQSETIKSISGAFRMMSAMCEQRIKLGRRLQGAAANAGAVGWAHGRRHR
jgi:hypothetical protein